MFSHGIVKTVIWDDAWMLLEDPRMRLAAVEQLKRASAAGVLTSDNLRAGFTYNGARVPLINLNGNFQADFNALRAQPAHCLSSQRATGLVRRSTAGSQSD